MARAAVVSPAAFVVGDWHVNPGLNQVSRNGQSAHVRPQLMDLLVYLAQNGGRTVHRDELQTHVWPDQPFITVTALPRCIAELRQALGDRAAASTMIQTVPKRGYRLIAPVRTIDDTQVPDVGGARSAPLVQPALSLVPSPALIDAVELPATSTSAVLPFPAPGRPHASPSMEPAPCVVPPDGGSRLRHRLLDWLLRARQRVARAWRPFAANDR